MTISQSAKSLVNSLLNSDPKARPSLDEVANHQFFKSGYFPRDIPITATKEAPQWPAAAGTAQALAANRAEWKRNYEEVARSAGVGIDSNGVPIQPVGADVGKPPAPVPISRPASVVSSVSNECAEIGKQVEKKKREQQLKDEALKANGGYVLPEALSPRDGHARMRNIGVLKSVPSRLGPLRTAATMVAQREAGVPSKDDVESEDSDEEMGDAEPIPEPIPEPPVRTRQIDKQPIRRSSTAETQAVTTALETVQISPRAIEAPPRRVTRSHAAQQRASTVSEQPPIRAESSATRGVRDDIPAMQQPPRRFTSAEPRRSNVEPQARAPPPSSQPQSLFRPASAQSQPQPTRQSQSQPLRQSQLQAQSQTQYQSQAQPQAQPQTQYNPQKRQEPAPQPQPQQPQYQRHAPAPQPPQPQYQKQTKKTAKPAEELPGVVLGKAQALKPGEAAEGQKPVSDTAAAGVAARALARI